jgi:hypothetical protein
MSGLSAACRPESPNLFGLERQAMRCHTQLLGLPSYHLAASIGISTRLLVLSPIGQAEFS